ncbi:MAG: FprA family A-type flavoprotein [Fusobacteriaceae bacterium]
MHFCAKITELISWIGVNDRKSDRFENYLPLPEGVTYNSYFINDTKTCVIDAVEFGTEGSYFDKIEHLLNGRNLDFLIINHMEPDHSGAIYDLTKIYPLMKVVGNKKTLDIIKCFHHNFDESKFRTISEGEILDLGYHKLTFAMMPMVHWPESMATYDTTEKILFSNDAFGSFGAIDGGIFDDEIDVTKYEDEMRRYYSNIVGKFGTQVSNVIKRLSTLEIKYICPSHGILWRKDINRVIHFFDNWAKFIPDEEGVVIVYGSMYGNTAKMAEALARDLNIFGIKNIKVYDASKVDASFIISDIWKYKGLFIGSCSHNNAVFPKVEPILSKLQNYGLKNKFLGIFGNMLWSGGGVRGIQSFADSLSGIEVIGESIEVKGAPRKEDYIKLENLAKKMACKILSKEIDSESIDCEK